MSVLSKPLIARSMTSCTSYTYVLPLQPWSPNSLIESLPDELLLEVFSILCFAQDASDPIILNTTKPVLTIAAVSRRFRAVIKSSPFIWANTVDFSRPRECVERFLELTGHRVYIHKACLDTLSCTAGNSTTAIWQWDLLIKGQNPFLERCRTLEIQSMRCFWNILQIMLTTRNIKNISDLRITFLPDECRGKEVPTLLFIAETTYPNLTSISLFDGTFNLPKGSFPALTYLSIYNGAIINPIQNSMSALDWVDFLKSVPQLEHLRLMGAIRKPRHTVTGVYLASSPVTLPKLKQLIIQDLHHGRMGVILDNLCVEPSCHISIKATVRSWEVCSVNGIPPDYIGGLLRFLKAHYSGEDAADLGSSLFIHADSKAGESFARLELVNFNRLGHRKVFPVTAERVPRFQLRIDVLGDLENEPFNINHSSSLYTIVHEKLATFGLTTQFASITNLYLLCTDESFVQSSAQRSFFQTFSNIRHLTLLDTDSLQHMTIIQDSTYVLVGLFPKLQVLVLIQVDFKRVQNDEVYDFSNPIWCLSDFLDKRIKLSVSQAVEQIQRIELRECSEGPDLYSYLGDLGVEVLSLK